MSHRFRKIEWFLETRSAWLDECRSAMRSRHTTGPMWMIAPAISRGKRIKYPPKVFSSFLFFFIAEKMGGERFYTFLFFLEGWEIGIVGISTSTSLRAAVHTCTYTPMNIRMVGVECPLCTRSPAPRKQANTQIILPRSKNWQKMSYAAWHTADLLGTRTAFR